MGEMIDGIHCQVVLVHVTAIDGTRFDTLLTRVPGIGEAINREDKSYLVLHVYHEPVEADGRARLGWHAFIDAELQPEEPERPRKRMQ